MTAYKLYFVSHLCKLNFVSHLCNYLSFSFGVLKSYKGGYYARCSYDANIAWHTVLGTIMKFMFSFQQYDDTFPVSVK